MSTMSSTISIEKERNSCDVMEAPQEEDHGRIHMDDFHGKALRLYNNVSHLLDISLPAFLCIGYLVFLGFALHFSPDGAVFLCVMTPVVLYVSVNKLTNRNFVKFIRTFLRKRAPNFSFSARISTWCRRILTVLCVVGVAVFLVVDIWDDTQRWIPLGGMTAFVVITFLFSTNKTKVDCVPVVWGILLQFALGFLILRWSRGYLACKWLGDQVTTLLSYTNKGSIFVFGEKYEDHPIIFKVFPVVIFFSGMMSVLYYLGVMQTIIKAIAIVLQITTRATPIESFSAAAHIFIGQLESSCALRPFLYKLTLSEIHVIMTGGLATVAGAVIAAYVEFGVPAEHVITASFMSAPAALAIAKLSLPETKVSVIKSYKDIKLPSGQESGVIEALSVGATTAIKLIAYCVVNLVAFIAVVDFLDAVVSYLGGRVGYPDLTFQLICSYVFMPLAVVMGVPYVDAMKVGGLIGKKLLTTEMLAYADLGIMMKKGEITTRSAVIATYILCGFGSFAGLGVSIGGLTSTAPCRRQDISRLSLRAMVNANIACFLTACVAGLLYHDLETSTRLELGRTLNSTLNSTAASVILANGTTDIP